MTSRAYTSSTTQANKIQRTIHQTAVNTAYIEAVMTCLHISAFPVWITEHFNYDTPHYMRNADPLQMSLPGM